MSRLEIWNQRFFDITLKRNEKNKRVRLFFDRNVLSEVSDGLSPEDALQDFLSAYKEYYLNGPRSVLENAVSDAHSLRKSNSFATEQPPIFLATLALAILAITDEKSHLWSAYRLLNQWLYFKDLKAESIPADRPQGYEDIPQLFRYWDEWLNQFNGKFGVPLEWKDKIPGFNHQEPARAHAFLENRDLRIIRRFFVETGLLPGIQIEPKHLVQEFINWSLFDDSSFSRRIQTYCREDNDEPIELLSGIVGDEYAAWDGNADLDSSGVTNLAILVQIDKNELDPNLRWSGIVRIDKSLDGEIINVDGQEIQLGADEYVTVTRFPECANHLKLPTKREEYLSPKLKARYKERKFLVLQSDQNFEGYLTEQRYLHLDVRYEVIASKTTEASIMAALRAYGAEISEVQTLGELVFLKNIVFSRTEPEIEIEFDLRFPIKRNERPKFVNGLSFGKNRFVREFLPKLQIPENISLNRINSSNLSPDFHPDKYSKECEIGRNRLEFTDGSYLDLEIIEEGLEQIKVSAKGSALELSSTSENLTIYPYAGTDLELGKTSRVMGAVAEIHSVISNPFRLNLMDIPKNVVEFREEYVEHFIFNPGAKQFYFYQVLRPQTWAEEKFGIWFCFIEVDLMLRDFMLNAKALGESIADTVFLVSRILTSSKNESKKAWRLEIRKCVIDEERLKSPHSNSDKRHIFNASGIFIKSILNISNKISIGQVEMPNVLEMLNKASQKDNSNNFENRLPKWAELTKRDEKLYEKDPFEILVAWISEQEDGVVSFERVSDAIDFLGFAPPFDYLFETLRQLEITCRIEIDFSNKQVRALPPCILFQKRTTLKTGVILGGTSLRQLNYLRNRESRSKSDYALRRLNVHTRDETSVRNGNFLGPKLDFISFPLNDKDTLKAFVDEFKLSLANDTDKIYQAGIPSIDAVRVLFPTRDSIKDAKKSKLIGVGPGALDGRSFVSVTHDQERGIYRYVRGGQERYLIRFQEGDDLAVCPKDWINHLFLYYFYPLINRGKTSYHYWQFKSQDDLLICPRYLRLPIVFEKFVFLRTLNCPELSREEVRYPGLTISPKSTIFEKFHLDQDLKAHSSLRVLNC
jgi:hypothetical protein